MLVKEQPEQGGPGEGAARHTYVPDSTPIEARKVVLESQLLISSLNSRPPRQAVSRAVLMSP
jgi:hypothetical protein